MSEYDPVIKRADDSYQELEMDSLPRDLRRDSRYYYYLSVYPGLRHMVEIEEQASLPTLPESVHSAYLHTPFCTGACSFCSYYLTVLPANKDQSPIDSYFETVKKEIGQRGQETDLDISYMYFGGGTPSLIPLKTLEGFFDFTSRNGFFSKNFQGTLELHPEFFKDHERAQTFIDILKANGVRRVSVGFESSDDHTLNATNRRHESSFLKEAIDFLKTEGMVINLDLMYGLPGMSLSAWRQTLADAVACQPDSITPYSLFVNPGTLMRRKVDRGEIKLPSHRLLQVQHIMAQQFLESNGYYELPSDFFGRIDTDPSNFTQTSLPSSSVSLPLGAGSYGFYDNTQFFNQFGIAKYRKDIEAGRSPIWRSYTFEGVKGLHRDVMFSFKNSPYLDVELCVQAYGVNPIEYFASQFKRLASYKLIDIDEGLGRVSLTNKGRLCVEEICWQFTLADLDDGATRGKAPPSTRRKLKKHHFAPLYEPEQPPEAL